MINKGKMNNTDDVMIQGLLDSYLRFHSTNSGINNDQHLDDDSLTAFVEGNLSERESTPILSHLVGCSFCRHVTAELVKLDFVFAGEEKVMPIVESAPSSVSDVLNNLLSRIFGTSDSAVLLHGEESQEKEAEEEDKKEA
jgi:hypothetical protein